MGIEPTFGMPAVVPNEAPSMELAGIEPELTRQSGPGVAGIGQACPGNEPTERNNPSPTLARRLASWISGRRLQPRWWDTGESNPEDDAL